MTGELTIRLRASNSKNKKGRPLVLKGEVLDVIQRRASLRRLDCPYVFHRNGRRISSLFKAWRKACEAAGPTGRYFHDMRRSAIRNFVRSGTPEVVAMAISGHKPRSVFDRYNIVNEADIAEAMARSSRYVADRRKSKRQVIPLRT